MSFILGLFAFIFISFPIDADVAAAPTFVRKPVACQFFTVANAEKLIGANVTAKDEEHTTEGDVRRWGCTFSSNISGGPKIHFLIVKNGSEEAAKMGFNKVRQSNRDHDGFEEWPDVADEAVVHSDGSGFHFVMIRKSTGTIRIKVNPARGVSLDELKTVAVSLAAKLK